MARVLVIGDTHFPFVNESYIDFLCETYSHFDCDSVVHIGDVVDNHAISFHDSEHDALGAENESLMAQEYVDQYIETFPEALVCLGNHDALVQRRAMKAGLPLRFIRDLGEIYQTGDWRWSDQHVIDGVLYSHGTGSSGKNHALNMAMNNRCPVVCGHTHTNLSVNYDVNKFDRIFGMNVGCGININAYAFRYGMVFPKRPVLGCGVVLDGETAIPVPMALERYGND